MSTEQAVNADTIEQTKQQIRGLVSEIAQLSKSELEADEYFAAFLQRVVSALAAVGGAVWVLSEGSVDRRFIRAGRERRPGMLEVISGLEEGERVLPPRN